MKKGRESPAPLIGHRGGSAPPPAKELPINISIISALVTDDAIDHVLRCRHLWNDALGTARVRARLGQTEGHVASTIQTYPSVHDDPLLWGIVAAAQWHAYARRPPLLRTLLRDDPPFAFAILSPEQPLTTAQDLLAWIGIDTLHHLREIDLDGSVDHPIPAGRPLYVCSDGGLEEGRVDVVCGRCP